MINKFLIAAIFCFSITGSHGQSTAPKLEIKQLTANFYIYTTYNEYKGGRSRLMVCTWLRLMV